MKKIKIHGVKLKVKEILTAPNNESVKNYLSDAEKGKGLAEYIFKKHKKTFQDLAEYDKKL